MIRTIITTLLAFWILGPAAAFADNGILILKSNDNRFFNITIEQLINSSDSDARFTILTLEDKERATQALSSAQLIVTLGYEAAQFATGPQVKAPVIHGYVTRFQHDHHGGSKQHTSILLEQSLSHYIRFVKHILSPTSIGIIKPEHEAYTKQQLQQASEEHGIKLNQRLYREGDNLINLLRDLLEDSDLLLALPAPQIYNRNTLKGILLTSYRLNKPLISYAPSHVKSGALAAIYTSPKKIGNQLAGMIDRILGNPGFEPHLFYYADDFDFEINEHVSNSLEITLPDKATLQRQLRKALQQ